MGTPSRATRWLVVAAIVAAGAGRASADESSPLDHARKAVDGSDYPSARAALTSALESGNASPDDLAEIYKLSGIVAAALGEPTAATTAFEKWLTLDPRGALPAGTSPKITKPFALAVEFSKRNPPVKVKADTSDDPPKVTLVIEDDPLHLITRARVVFIADDKPEKTIDGAGIDSIVIPLPEAARIDLRIAALDQYGNHVVEVGTPDVPLVIVGRARPADTRVARAKPVKPAGPYHPRPLIGRWWLWTGITVALAGGATYLGIVGRSDVNTLAQWDATSVGRQYLDAKSLENRANLELWSFDIGMGVAGATAITAAILYLTDHHDRERARLAAVPISGGGLVVLGGGF